MKKKILVVIPTYNCEKQISRLLSSINSDILPYINTIIVINNQSEDNTEYVSIKHLKKIRNINSILIRNTKNYGYGGSLKIGFEYAIKHSFDWVIVLNGDDQSPLADFLPLLESGEYEKYEVMWGCRFLKESQRRNYPLIRTIANYIFNFLFSIVLQKPVHDIGCGVYMYSTRILKERFYLKLPDVLYIGTFLRLAHDYYNHQFCEFPVSWNSDDQDSSVKAVSQTLAQFKLAAQYLFCKRKFFLMDHRLNKYDQFISEIIFSNSLENVNLNRPKNFIVLNTELIRQ